MLNLVAKIMQISEKKKQSFAMTYIYFSVTRNKLYLNILVWFFKNKVHSCLCQNAMLIFNFDQVRKIGIGIDKLIVESESDESNQKLRTFFFEKLILH
jgi:hypothetical protein